MSYYLYDKAPHKNHNKDRQINASKSYKTNYNLEIMKQITYSIILCILVTNTTAKHFPKLVIVFATQWEGLSGHYTENGP
jgi:hypothetical protein